MAIEAFVFDGGGVLAETPPTGWDRRWCRRRGLSRPELLRRREASGNPERAMADFFVGLGDHYRTGILSNSFVGARQRERHAYNLESMGDVVVYSHEEGMKKPESRFYELVCRRLGVVPEQVLLVDNTPMYAEAARPIGMTGVVFIENEQAIGDIGTVLSSGVTGVDRWA